MEVLNQKERTRFTVQSIALYLVAAIIVVIVSYVQFVVTPPIHYRETALTNDKVDELVRYTKDADSLVVQIQRARTIEAAKLVPFYDWTNDLRTVYKQPFYVAVISSYGDLVKEIAAAKSQDTATVNLQKKLVEIQQSNIRMMGENDDLKNQLKTAKKNLAAGK